LIFFKRDSGGQSTVVDSVLMRILSMGLWVNDSWKLIARHGNAVPIFKLS
jgi:hypothetical protein